MSLFCKTVKTKPVSCIHIPSSVVKLTYEIFVIHHCNSNNDNNNNNNNNNNINNNNNNKRDIKD